MADLRNGGPKSLTQCMLALSTVAMTMILTVCCKCESHYQRVLSQGCCRSRVLSYPLYNHIINTSSQSSTLITFKHCRCPTIC